MAAAEAPTFHANIRSLFFLNMMARSTYQNQSPHVYSMPLQELKMNMICAQWQWYCKSWGNSCTCANKILTAVFGTLLHKDAAQGCSTTRGCCTIKTPEIVLQHGTIQGCSTNQANTVHTCTAFFFEKEREFFRIVNLCC